MAWTITSGPTALTAPPYGWVYVVFDGVTTSTVQVTVGSGTVAELLASCGRSALNEHLNDPILPAQITISAIDLVPHTRSSIPPPH